MKGLDLSPMVLLIALQILERASRLKAARELL